jgi:hypothetical protein
MNHQVNGVHRRGKGDGMVVHRESRQRREGEADRSSRSAEHRPPGIIHNRAESVRLADQAVVAFAGAAMTNRAEPRACG